MIAGNAGEHVLRRNTLCGIDIWHHHVLDLCLDDIWHHNVFDICLLASLDVYVKSGLSKLI